MTLLLAALSTVLSNMSYSSDFPLHFSPDHRTLLTKEELPFPILGRTAWFVLSLSKEKQDLFLDDTLKRGFNTIEFSLINHDSRGNHAPFDGEGNAPFLKSLDGKSWSGKLTYATPGSEVPDFSILNPRYWASAEQFIDRCAKHGILALAFPAYVGYEGGEQGWMKEVVANGPVKTLAYGKALGELFKGRGNIVWMAGGDLGRFTPDQKAACSALYEGINGVKGAKSKNWSAEWDSGMIGTDQADFDDLMTLNSVYLWTGSPAALGLRAYGHTPVKPAFLLEEPYDEEGPDGNNVNPNAHQPVRKFQWWGWLTTIGGYVAGNGYIWPFRTDEWEAHLDTKGSRDMAVLNKFVHSIQWWTLRPNSLTNTPSDLSANDFVTTATSPSGDLLVSYFPPEHPASVTFDLSSLSINRLRWMDPTNGKFRDVSGLVPVGRMVLTPPGLNAAGDSDWVLVGDRRRIGGGCITDVRM